MNRLATRQVYLMTLNVRKREASDAGSYRKPSTVGVDEKFYIKIQGSA